MDYPWHLFLLSFLLIAAGILHFIKPRVYMRIMPRYLPNHKTLVYLSGIAEILVGIGLLIPTLKTIAVYGGIAMLIVFLLVHFYMLSGKKASAGYPKWLLILRIPLQFALMYWIYSYL